MTVSDWTVKEIGSRVEAVEETAKVMRYLEGIAYNMKVIGEAAPPRTPGLSIVVLSDGIRDLYCHLYEVADWLEHLPEPARLSEPVEEGE